MRKPSRSNDVFQRQSAQPFPRFVVPDEAECCDTATLSPDDSVMMHPHRLEQDVRNRLMSDPNLNFTSLVVRRVGDGLCLEGVLETNGDPVDVARLVRRVCGVPKVLNHLVIHRARELPRKG